MTNSQKSDVQKLVLLNTFSINNKRYRVFYNDGHLIWEQEKTKKGKTSIPIEDIISVKKEKIRNSSLGQSQTTLSVLDATLPSVNSSDSPSNSSSASEDYKTITINYAKRLIDPNSEQGNSCSEDVNKWRIHSITLFNNDKLIVREWFETLTKILNDLRRPKKLLLFVNPYGGKQNALSLYEKYAKPIFLLANIDVSVVITQRQNQIFDLVLQQNLELYDGIITCGGDGTFSELFNGIIYKDILKTNPNEPLMTDLNNIPKPSKTLGIIPAGSTDSIAYCLHGTADIKTCIIQIVLGQTTGMDISSVSNSSGILRFYASALAYGFLGDVQLESENHRWLGPKRYDYSGFKKLIGNRSYDVEIMIQKEPEANDSDVIINCDENQSLKCYESCSKCSLMDKSENNNEEEIEEKYQKISGKVFMILGANISCACQRSPSGVAPDLHIGDGYNDLIIIRHGSLWNNLQFLLTASKDDGDISKLPFVEKYRTKKFHVKALNGTSLRSLSSSTQPISVMPNKHSSVWNCDGEIIQEPEVTVRCHRQLITVFRRGATSMSNSDAPSSCCFG